MLYASLRMFGRWPSKLQYKNDLQDVVMAVCIMAILHLYMMRTYNFHGNVIGGLFAKRALTKYSFELEETNMLLCVILLMNALCFYAPAGIDVLFVIVFVTTVGYVCLSCVFGTPEHLSPTRGSILFMLGGFALLGAYSREKHARSDWMSKATVVRQERLIEDQLVHIEESEFGGFPSVCPRCGEVLSMISQAATPAVPQAASASSAVSDTSSERSEKSILSNTIGSSGSSGATGESVIERPEVETFAQTLIVHRANSSFWNQFGSAWEANQYSVGFSDNWFSEVNANAVESTLCRDRHGRDCGLFFNSISKSYELIFIPDLADFPLVLCHEVIEFEHMFPAQESEKFKRFVQKHIAQMTPGTIVQEFVGELLGHFGHVRPVLLQVTFNTGTNLSGSDLVARAGSESFIIKVRIREHQTRNAARRESKYFADQRARARIRGRGGGTPGRTESLGPPGTNSHKRTRAHTPNLEAPQVLGNARLQL